MRIACWSGVVVALGLVFGACLIDQRSVFPRLPSGGDGAAGGDSGGGDAPEPADGAGGDGAADGDSGDGDAPGPADSAGGDSTSSCGNGQVELPAEVCDWGNTSCGACSADCTQAYLPATGSITVDGWVQDGEWVLLCNGLGSNQRFELDVFTAADLQTGDAEAAVTWTATTPGAAGNSITVELVDPGADTADVVVQVIASEITVTLKRTAGVLSSTADEVVNEVNDDGFARQLVVAGLLTGHQGTGVVQACAQQSLSGGTDGDDVMQGIRVAVVDGEVAEEVAVALAAAINVDTVLSLTATWEPQAPPRVLLEARHVGQSFCSLDSSGSNLRVQDLTGGGGTACVANQLCVNHYDCLSGVCTDYLCE